MLEYSERTSFSGEKRFSKIRSSPKSDAPTIHRCLPTKPKVLIMNRSDRQFKTAVVAKRTDQYLNPRKKSADQTMASTKV